ncbi:MAG: glycosyltransferase family 2 protein [Phycisphaeraceae bacterium]
MMLIELVLLVGTLPVVLAILVVAVEGWAGFLLPSGGLADDAEPGTIAVLVPAHNEEAGIEVTLRSMLSELREKDRLLVVADNCTDRTAEIARSAGAEVIERFDEEQRGKGYALAYGIESLGKNPPATLVIADADCVLRAGSLRPLARQAEVSGRPAQAVYLLDPPTDAGIRDRVSVLAFLFKNLVRPRGLARLGLSCPMTGTGMALPWALVGRVSWASGHLVEDMQLGIDLALRGQGARLCEEALVTSAAPSGERASNTQRTRWEHGHLETLVRHAPRLIVRGLLRGRLEPVMAGVDLAVPPLAILCVGWLALTVVLVPLALLLGVGSLAALLLVETGVVLLVTVLVAVVRDGGERVRVRDLLAVPGYVLWKIPLYVRFFIDKQTTWVRTERPQHSDSEKP